MNTADNLTRFYERLAEIYKLECVASLLGWDEQVYMPTHGAEARAGQIEYIARLIHQKKTDPAFATTVDELWEHHDSLSSGDQVNVRETKRILDIERKLPEEYVSELAQVSSLGFHAWVKARTANDFKAVQPYLEKIVELSRRRADLVGYEEHPYDALLDIYEPGLKTSVAKPLLLDLAEKLRGIIPAICERFCRYGELNGHYAEAQQEQLCRRVAGDLGFSFDSGRLDKSPHPFTTSIGPKDTRITTRYNESNFMPALYGTIHETGHALYDMGLPDEWAGTPLGEPVSLGIHESQSRLWENRIGRSREYCVYLSLILSEVFPGETMDPETLWQHANRVSPSLIRVEADEVTYSQHIVIRMLLEEMLITNELGVTDLPGAWDDLYERYLGVRPTDDRNGVMQDMHWYSGAIGYFPTYALGNLYGAMMMEKAREDLPDLDQQIERGQFGGLHGWLHENVYQHGMRFHGPELIRRITGRDLSAQPFVDYLKAKYLKIIVDREHEARQTGIAPATTNRRRFT